MYKRTKVELAHHITDDTLQKNLKTAQNRNLRNVVVVDGIINGSPVKNDHHGWPIY